MTGGPTPGLGASAAGEAWDEHAYKVLTVAAASVLAIGTVVFHYLEDWSWVDSLYFSVVAVTTVGFGDLAPTTDAAKLFTVAYILAGISILGLFLNQRMRRTQFRHRARVERRRPDQDDD
ncbi:MAG: potassium channel family protein [Acidimicrobiia bacterium]|nr:MAG: potassium channel family protein [Acidimicrobiia bacterium]